MHRPSLGVSPFTCRSSALTSPDPIYPACSSQRSTIAVKGTKFRILITIPCPISAAWVPMQTRTLLPLFATPHHLPFAPRRINMRISVPTYRTRLLPCGLMSGTHPPHNLARFCGACNLSAAVEIWSTLIPGSPGSVTTQPLPDSCLLPSQPRYFRAAICTFCFFSHGKVALGSA